MINVHTPEYGTVCLYMYLYFTYCYGDVGKMYMFINHIIIIIIILLD